MEKGLAKQLRRFFTNLEKKILVEFDNTDNQFLYLFKFQMSEIIAQNWRIFDIVLKRYLTKSALLGIKYYDYFVNYGLDRSRSLGLAAMKSEINQTDKKIFSTNPRVVERLTSDHIAISKSVRTRIDGDLNKILTEGYKEGLGREDIKKRLQEKFTKLTSYEAQRIAVTEINSLRNETNFLKIQDDDVKFKQWITAEDSRVRPSHAALNGHIVRTDSYFSNGLMHPGDKLFTPIKEWVNCRCVLVPYFMPWGKKAPELEEFTEEQLIDENESIEDIFKKFGKPSEPVSVTVEAPIEEDIVRESLNGTKIKYRSTKYLTSKEDQEVYEKLSTPEECADFFGLKYRPQKNKITGKTESMIFEDQVNHTEIYFDNYFVNGKGGKEFLDMKNKGTKNYNLKDVLRYYDEAPQAYKECTGSIAIMKKGRDTDPYALADTAPLWEYEGDKRHYNRVCVYDGTFKHKQNERGNPQQAIYHEMGHNFDFSYMKRQYVEVFEAGRKPPNRYWVGLSRRDSRFNVVRTNQNNFQRQKGYKIRKASWYGEDDHGGITEDFAETMSIAAFDKNPDKSLANMQYELSPHHYKTVPYDEWLPPHRKTYDFCVDLLKNYNPAERTFVQRENQYTIREALIDDKITKAISNDVTPSPEQMKEYKNLSLKDKLTNNEQERLDKLDEVMRLGEYMNRSMLRTRFTKKEYNDFKKLYNDNKDYWGLRDFDIYVEDYTFNKSLQRLHRNN